MYQIMTSLQYKNLGAIIITMPLLTQEIAAFTQATYERWAHESAATSTKKFQQIAEQKLFTQTI